MYELEYVDFLDTITHKQMNKKKAIDISEII